MATPSTFGSVENASDARSRSGTARRSRSAQARSSSSENALSRLIIGTRWRTSWNRPVAAPRPPSGSASRAWRAPGGPIRAGAARRSEGRTRRRGSRARRARSTARCGAGSGSRSSSARAAASAAPSARPVAAPRVRRRCPAPDHGVGIVRRRRGPPSVRAPPAAGATSKRTRSPPRPRPVHGARDRPPVRAHLRHGPGTAARAGVHPRHRVVRRRSTDERTTAAAPPTVTRRAVTSTCVT